MSFSLNGVYMTDSLLRSYILGTSNPSDVEKFSITGESTLSRKLNIVIPVVSNETFIEKFMVRINSGNIDNISSVLLLNKSHLLALMYLSYENRLSDETLSSILNSNNDRNRTEILLSLLDEKESDRIDMFGPLITLINEMDVVKNPGELITIGKSKQTVIDEITSSRKYVQLRPSFSNINYGNYYYRTKDKDIPLKYCGTWIPGKVKLNQGVPEDTVVIDDLNLPMGDPGSVSVFQKTGSLLNRIPMVSGFENFWKSWGEILIGGGNVRTTAYWLSDLSYGITSLPLDKYIEEYKLGYSIGDWWFNDKVQRKFMKYNFSLRNDRIIADAFGVSLLNYITDKYSKRLSTERSDLPNIKEILMRAAIPHTLAAISSIAPSYEYGNDNEYTTHLYSGASTEDGIYNVYNKIINEIDGNTTTSSTTYTGYQTLAKYDDSGYTYGEIITIPDSIDSSNVSQLDDPLVAPDKLTTFAEMKNVCTVFNIFKSLTNKKFSILTEETHDEDGNSSIDYKVDYDTTYSPGSALLDNFNFMTRLIGSYNSSGKSEFIKDYEHLLSFDILSKDNDNNEDFPGIIENFGSVDFGKVVLKIIKAFSSKLTLVDDNTSRYIEIAEIDTEDAKEKIDKYLRILEGSETENKSYIIDSDMSTLDIIKEYFALRMIKNYLAYLKDDSLDIDEIKTEVFKISKDDYRLYHLLYIARHMIIDARNIRNSVLENPIAVNLKSDPTGTNEPIRSLYNETYKLLRRNTSAFYALLTNNKFSPESFGASESGLGDTIFERILTYLLLGDTGIILSNLGSTGLQKISRLETTYNNITLD